MQLLFLYGAGSPKNISSEKIILQNDIYFLILNPVQVFSLLKGQYLSCQSPLPSDSFRQLLEE